MAQYILFTTLTNHIRPYWKSIGHKDVPDNNCSCGFQGDDKPPTCIVHPSEVYDDFGNMVDELIEKK